MAEAIFCYAQDKEFFVKQALIAIFKLVFFILILPIIIAIVTAFGNQVVLLPAKKTIWIYWGALGYIVLYLFAYNFQEVHAFGQSMIEKCLAFFKPAVYIFPIYAILLTLGYFITTLLEHHHAFQSYFLSAIAFFAAMHLVLTAREIYEADKGLLKSHYLLCFGLIVVVFLSIASLLLACVMPEFSLIEFFKSAYYQIIYQYHFIYQRLFMDTGVLR
ncbi:MAG: hypothetical protein HQL13_00430 [Candidatus Omnitrophica bacterium]|nr:hypothetical protein [Candidatus Omnitrophota bacterium]